MKRIITGLALASAATLLAAGPAQAEPAAKDPVTAVTKQFVAGKGVKFSERTTAIEGNRRNIIIRQSGTYQFSNAGVAASETTGNFTIKALASGDDKPAKLDRIEKALITPERTITIGKWTYLSGGLWEALLPTGKTWFLVRKGPVSGLTSIYGQPLNLTEAATLKTLIKGAKAAEGGYAGKITVGDLLKVSPYFRGSFLGDMPNKKSAKVAISWKLTVDAEGLPARLVTTYPLTALYSEASKHRAVSVETLYSGWGSTVEIAAPPIDQVTEEFKNGEDEIPSLEIPLSRIVH
ncbi:hypothetical protein AB0L53_12795 [Nonomuraea sp. NPDC052129]|uniref:hypothetical protein n=1 Tax=Nonomuraea sp. NPDC052129 TaxID=3154651 RepID=UPI0034309866